MKQIVSRPNTAQARENVNTGFEFPQDRWNISAGPYNLFAQDSAFSQSNQTNRETNAQNRTHEQGVHAQVDSNALILKLLQKDCEDQNEKKIWARIE